MDNRTKNHQETEYENMGPEIDRKRQKIESSSSDHKAIDSGIMADEGVVVSSHRPNIEKMGLENTEDSDPIAKAKALVRKARESGACDYSSFPPDWLGINYSPMIACEGSRNYHFGLKMASYALDRIKDEDPVNDGKTFEVVRVDKIAILFYDHYLMQFTVREVVANADAPLKTILAHVYFPDYRDAEVSKWRWFHPSQFDSAASL
ncbi:hypothetical protein CASFOL_006061 [Castilleja foliolosa]|uniref:Uncharacterized protein n=1 Tax=Castilleja foliolosa TaxID=1961234 RepID=A0ABD3E585_9LAMI